MQTDGHRSGIVSPFGFFVFCQIYPLLLIQWKLLDVHFSKSCSNSFGILEIDLWLLVVLLRDMLRRWCWSAYPMSHFTINTQNCMLTSLHCIFEWFNAYFIDALPLITCVIGIISCSCLHALSFIWHMSFINYLNICSIPEFMRYTYALWWRNIIEMRSSICKE